MGEININVTHILKLQSKCSRQLELLSTMSQCQYIMLYIPASESSGLEQYLPGSGLCGRLLLHVHFSCFFLFFCFREPLSLFRGDLADLSIMNADCMDLFSTCYTPDRVSVTALRRLQSFLCFDILNPRGRGGFATMSASA